MWEIWTDSSGVGALVHDLTAALRKEFLDAGLKLELTLKATNDVAAKEEFIAWCKVQCPDAQVEHHDLTAFFSEDGAA